MKDNMFYKASPLIFKKAEELRSKQTSAEVLLWDFIGQGQLGVKFRRQHPASIYVLDFYAHQIKLAIEIDGSIHSNEDVKRNDKKRQTHLDSLGVRFLRFSNQDVLSNIEHVLEKIKREINIFRLPVSAPFRAGGITIIPAIDIIDGKCVRLSQGDYAQKKIYNENPLEVAKQFEDAGIKRLHLVDLDGAKKGTLVNLKVLETIASGTKLIIDFGGGIKTDADIRSVYGAGAAIATIGSLAVKDPELFFSWIKKYGADKMLLGADVSPGPKGGNTNEEYCLAINGWHEKTNISIFNFIKTNFENGVQNIFCTDISKDGMMKGASAELYKKIIAPFRAGGDTFNLIASGGISSIKDIEAVQLAGCSGAIVGKAIYEGNISLTSLKPYLS